MNLEHSFRAAALLSAFCVSTSFAQSYAPVALRAFDNKAPALAQFDTTAHEVQQVSATRMRQVRTVVGGAVGGVAGTLMGIAIAGQTSRGCHGEFCGIGDFLLGVALGESIGLAVGSHLASGATGPERLMLTTLSSVAILAGGVAAGAGLAQAGAGGVMIPLTPALQLAAAAFIESH